MMIHIVIPVYNRLNYTRSCLTSIYEQTFRNFQVIVVDDGSTDGTPQALAREFPEANVIKTEGNLFWTASINLGISYSLQRGAKFVLTMNNDTVINPDFLSNMHDVAKKHPHSLIGALELDAVSHQPHYGGEKINWWTAGSKELLDTLESKEQHGLYEVDLYPARGLLVPRDVFEKIGLFDNVRLPHYLADYDFTLRARKAGYKVYCNYDAPVYTFPEESGDFQTRKTKSLKGYFRHLFGIKGGGNLRNYTVYTLKNCPKWIVPIALLAGYLRRMVGFWAH